MFSACIGALGVRKSGGAKVSPDLPMPKMGQKEPKIAENSAQRLYGGHQCPRSWTESTWATRMRHILAHFGPFWDQLVSHGLKPKFGHNTVLRLYRIDLSPFKSVHISG